MANTPGGRQRNVTGKASGLSKHGEGLGTGPVGSGGGYQGRGGSAGERGPSSANGGYGTQRASSAGASLSVIGLLLKLFKKKPILILVLIAVIAVAVIFISKSGMLSAPAEQADLSGGVSQQGAASQGGAASGASSGLSLGSLFGGFSSQSDTSAGWTREANTGKLDTTVAADARAKYTNIIGGGKDTVTIMVYMCGADLESRSGMATSDLQEMLNANIGSNVNLLVYTGGAKTWKNSTVSSKTCQIYKIENKGLKLLKDNLGDNVMTDPATLTDFIGYCSSNYPANRNMLIFWDHGGGSLSGYGYDERHANAGSMPLNGINRALKAIGMKFDFIGFDACLMATVENAMMLSDYADYLIASEETEPGIGWYYTDWLTKLSGNTSAATVEIGKNIADDFVEKCAAQCRGQGTTLSVVDLAELEATVPAELKAFASSATQLMQNDSYKTVSTARSGAREFAASSRIDQVDLTSLACRLGTKEAESLVSAILGAVKYNRTSSGMTDAYGLSIYFPYQKTSKVDSAVSAYSALGMDSAYSDCIKKFASLETSGQAVSGGTASASSMLTGIGGGSSGLDFGSLLSGLFGGRALNIDGLDDGNTEFMDALTEQDGAYLAENSFDASALVWKDGGITLSEQQWGLVDKLELNVFYDDGEGYIDLGLDNIFSVSEDGTLAESYDGCWLAINGQIVPYYHTLTVNDGKTESTSSGYVPALLNGETRINLIVTFEGSLGSVSGIEFVYRDGETETVAKNGYELQSGDRIEFVCDYYSYDGTYRDSYLLGTPVIYDGSLTVSDMELPDVSKANACFRFTDLFNQHYWTPVIGR